MIQPATISTRRTSGFSKFTPRRIRKGCFRTRSAEWLMSGHNNRPFGRTRRASRAPIVDGMHLMTTVLHAESHR